MVDEIILFDAKGQPLIKQEKLDNSSTNLIYLSQPTETGVEIDEDDLLSIDTVFTCVNIISDAIASLPLNVLRKTEKGREKEESHPLYHLLETAPNDEQTSFEWRKSEIIKLLLFGNSYNQVIRENPRDKFSDPIMIYPLDRRNVTVNRAPDDDRLIYIYKAGNNKEEMLEAWEVLHFRGFSENGIVGESLLKYHKETFGAAKAFEAFGNKFFNNAATPSGVLEIEKKLGDETYQQIKNQWEQKRQSLENAHKPLILGGGAKWKTISISNDQAQYLESRKFNKAIICGIFRVPAHLANDLDHATFSNIEHQDLGFSKHTLRPWCKNLESRLKLTFIPRDQWSTIYISHNLKEMEKADLKTRTEAYNKFIQDGVYSPNDVLKKEDENTYEGGDVHMVNGNMISVESIGKSSEPANDSDPKPDADEESNAKKIEGFETLKAEADAYGVAVRSGRITPQKEDEVEFRKAGSLPPLSSEAIDAWDKDGGVRRPITLQSQDAFEADQNTTKSSKTDSTKEDSEEEDES